MKLDIGAYTDTGLQRDHNEDALDMRVPDDPAARDREGVLLAVADGMGGHLAGEGGSGRSPGGGAPAAAGGCPSRMAVETLLRGYAAGPDEPAGALIAAIQ